MTRYLAEKFMGMRVAISDLLRPTEVAFVAPEEAPGVRRIIVLDIEAGSLVVHEVRRDPETGLTVSSPRMV